jgi:hypothetical protein
MKDVEGMEMNDLERIHELLHVIVIYINHDRHRSIVRNKDNPPLKG